MRFFRKRLPKSGNDEGPAKCLAKKYDEFDDTNEMKCNPARAATDHQEKNKSKEDESRGPLDEKEKEKQLDPFLAAELQQKRFIIEQQRKREEVAKANNTFVANQQVTYFFKATETWYDATIAGVHYDDGPDRPYYTIRFWRNDIEFDEDHCVESAVRRVVEKQTTPDRLRRVEFDPEQTWRILNNSTFVPGVN
ncbi:hypothetical protein MHU86_10716 [Fragilaria crotonensis]|nr:hypothetical protein MHU86_10716 [Fragilaria crotonensis]